MSRIDEELSRRFHRAERLVPEDQVVDRLVERRRRAEVRRRAGSAVLAFVVLAGTVGGVIFLDRAFRGHDAGILEPTGVANGPLVTSVRQDVRNGQMFHLELVPLDGSASMPITKPGDGVDGSPSASPDGRYVAYDHEGDQAGDAGVRILDLITGASRDLIAGPTEGPSWSPDGASIAMMRSVKGEWGIWIVSADGTGEPRLVTNERVGGPPSWSPDGRMLTFEVSDSAEGDPPGVVVFDLATGAQRFLASTDGDTGANPVWSPDGTRIAFGISGGIWAISPAGGEPVLVAGSSRDRWEAANYPPFPAFAHWSPDGAKLAYVLSGLDEDAVFVDSLDGSEPVRMSEGREVAWLPYNEAVTLPSTSPSPLAEAEGIDIGLDQRLCRAEWLGSIDFRGDGVGGSAWTGVFVKDDGTCPMSSDEDTIVAADWTGDKVADDWWGPFQYCNYCVPFERTDLNADGRQELVIQHLFSIVDYNFFAVVENHGSLELEPLRVAEPGHPEAQLEPGRMLTVTAGGDAGYGSYLHCEGYPDNITLVWTWLFSAVESGDPVEVHESRIALGDDKLFHVVEARDFTVAQSIDAGVDTYTGPSCGVRWDIWAPSPT